MDHRELVRTVQRQGAEIRELRAMLGNKLSRTAPPPPPQRLIVDHNHGDDLQGTPVYERGIRGPGRLEDVLKVIPNARGKSDTDTAPSKLALSIASAQSGGSAGHDEGLVWGNVASLTPTDDFGWGTWSDIVGVESTGGSYLNIMTWAYYCNGNEGDDRKSGPLLFDDTEDNLFASDDLRGWYLGKICWYQGWWYPCYQMPTEVYTKTRPVATTPNYSNHEDHCRIFRFPPIQWEKLQNYRVWTLRIPGSNAVNVHQVAACNRDDINGTFRALYRLDEHYGYVTGWHDNWLDQMYGSAALITAYLNALYAFCVCVFNNVASVAANCGTQKTQMDSANSAYNLVQPYTPQCPISEENRYEDPWMFKCLFQEEDD